MYQCCGSESGRIRIILLDPEHRPGPADPDDPTLLAQFLQIYMFKVVHLLSKTSVHVSLEKQTNAFTGRLRIRIGIEM
jgi:hypothetical protein